MNDRYDLVVIGAGPAGLMAALSAVKKGVSVLLLEKDDTVGLPVNCAEAVSLFSFDKLITPRPDWIKTIIEKVRLFAPSGRYFELHHPRAGYVLDRAVMEKELSEMVTGAGGVLMTGTRAVKLHDTDHGFDSVEIEDSSGATRIVKAKIFIAADGVESQIARLAGIDNLLPLPTTEPLLQYRVEGIQIDRSTVEFYVGNDIAPGAYAWIFPRGENQANVGLGVNQVVHQRIPIEKFLKRFVRQMFGEVTVTGKSCGTCPPYHGERMMALKNMLVVGDAARTLDALSGAGIANAMLSGKIAGEAASMFITGILDSYESLYRHYPGNFLKVKDKELQWYANFKKLFIKFSDRDFEDLVSGLDDYFVEKTVTSINPIRDILGVIKKRPRVLKVARHLFF